MIMVKFDVWIDASVVQPFVPCLLFSSIIFPRLHPLAFNMLLQFSCGLLRGQADYDELRQIASTTPKLPIRVMCTHKSLILEASLVDAIT